MVGKVIAYDDWGNANEVINMKQLDEAGKKLMLKNYGNKILKNILNGKNGALN